MSSTVQSLDKTYSAYIRNQSSVIDNNLKWDTNDFTFRLESSFSGDCSSANKDYSYLDFYTASSIAASFNLTLVGSQAAATAFCSDTSATLASKISAATISGHKVNGTSTTSAENEAFRTKILAKTKSSTTIAQLCAIWGY